MGTTLTGLFVGKCGTLSINIGDSRVYGLKDKQLSVLTIDHTWVMDMVKAGQLTIQQALAHPKRNVITNALGVWSSVRMDLEVLDTPYDLFLICSDGLYGYVNHQCIEDVINDDLTTQSKLRQLLALALKAGGYDNISIILIDRKDDGE